MAIILSVVWGLTGFGILFVPYYDAIGAFMLVLGGCYGVFCHLEAKRFDKWLNEIQRS